MLVLVELLVVVHAGFAVLVDQAELELVEVVGAEAEFAGRVLAATLLAHRGTGIRFLLVAHGIS